jgi:hypothetical protein
MCPNLLSVAGSFQRRVAAQRNACVLGTQTKLVG